jgi:peptidoglycan/xylan/chitin deacetylase (PgdA/CDA1 family)
MTVTDPHLDHPSDHPSATHARRIDVARPLRPAVLAYHELSADETQYTYTLPCRQFEEHLQLAGAFRNAAATEDRLLISFDDGHISNYTSALPLLEKHSLRAIFFVIASRIGQRQDFMTWNHLKELVSLGHRVEAHGWSHTFLTSCSDPELRNEINRAKETVEDRLGAAVSALSAPHGRWDGRVLRACAEAGYQQLYTSNPWSHRRTGQVEVIGRLIVVQSLNVERLGRWLTMGRTEAALHRAKQNLKDSARHVLGDKLYYQMWSRFSGFTGPDDYASESKPAT